MKKYKFKLTQDILLKLEGHYSLNIGKIGEMNLGRYYYWNKVLDNLLYNGFTIVTDPMNICSHLHYGAEDLGFLIERHEEYHNQYKDDWLLIALLMDNTDEMNNEKESKNE